MATEIKITKDLTIKINFETQTSPKGRPFRLSGISLVTKKPSVYNKQKNMYFHNTVYIFRYLDNEDGFFAFEFTHDNKLLQKINL